MTAKVRVQRNAWYALGTLCMTMAALGFCAAATMGATGGVPIGQAVAAGIRLHLHYRSATLATRPKFGSPPIQGGCVAAR